MNRTISTEARALRGYLNTIGIDLRQHQALEAVSRINGHRDLHAAQITGKRNQNAVKTTTEASRSDIRGGSEVVAPHLSDATARVLPRRSDPGLTAKEQCTPRLWAREPRTPPTNPVRLERWRAQNLPLLDRLTPEGQLILEHLLHRYCLVFVDHSDIRKLDLADHLVATVNDALNRVIQSDWPPTSIAEQPLQSALIELRARLIQQTLALAKTVNEDHVRWAHTLFNDPAKRAVTEAHHLANWILHRSDFETDAPTTFRHIYEQLEHQILSALLLNARNDPDQTLRTVYRKICRGPADLLQHLQTHSNEITETFAADLEHVAATKPDQITGIVAKLVHVMSPVISERTP